MCKSLVGFSHTVCLVLLLDCSAGVIESIHNLSGKFLSHGSLAALSRVESDPTQAECLTTLGANLQRHLIGGAADTLSLDLKVEA